jgi:hypothetical protein
MEMKQHRIANFAPATSSALRQKLTDLDSLATSQLRALWQRQYQAQVPRTLRRDLLIRFIAHRLQEEELGGLGRGTLRRLETVAGKLQDPDRAPSPDMTSLKPGTTLVREWNGTTHTVLVLEDGFELKGERYASLTKVAAVISGLHRSGPAFFGLKSRLTRFAEWGRGPRLRDESGE